jgi:hypothetical protein
MLAAGHHLAGVHRDSPGMRGSDAGVDGYRRCPAGRIELAGDVFEMRLRGPFGDRRATRDLAVGGPGCHMGHDLPFAGGQRRWNVAIITYRTTISAHIPYPGGMSAQR